MESLSPYTLPNGADDVYIYDWPGQKDRVSLDRGKYFPERT